MSILPEHTIATDSKSSQMGRIEDALRESEERFRCAFEHASIGMAMTGSDGRPMSVNSSLCRILGYTQEELTRLTFQEITIPEDLEESERLFAQTIAGERESFQLEKRYRHKLGHIVWAHTTASVVRDAEGRPWYLLAQIQDISEWKAAEEALQNLVAGTSVVTGQEFFPELVKHLAAALGVRYALVSECVDGNVNRVRSLAFWADKDWNSQIEYDVKGTTCEAVLTEGRTCYYPDHVKDMFPLERKALEKMHAVCYMGTPLFDLAGHTIGHMFIIDDKSLKDAEWTKSIMSIFAARAAVELQRIRADERIREQATFLDKAQDAILVRDMTGSIHYWNKSAERLYGWTAQEVYGRNANELLYKAVSSELHHAINAVQEKGEWTGELSQVTKAGREVLVESRWTLIRDAEGNPRSILIINSDITEKKALDAHYLRAQRMESIGTLAGGIAHDLNNVLTPIMLAVQTLQAKPTDERTAHLLDMIYTNAKRGGDMANQVLAFARGVEGQHTRLEVRHLVKEMEKIARETFPKSILIQTKIGKNISTISGNATQLHQVLLNLCLNARDAMPAGGSLRLTVENVQIDQHYVRMHPESRPGHFVCISVTDTGSGIQPAVIQRMFEPFFTTKETGKGTGLGLSTVLAIVKSHSGFVNVYSEVGKGSKFRVYLPADELPSDATHDQPAAYPSGNGELVLVVDDEASIREATKSILETYGYKVVTAGDGTEALAEYARHGKGIHVVVTDMMMPYLDGAGLVRALEKMNPSVRIVATSGFVGNKRSTDPTSRHIKAFLAKPYTAESLLQAISKALR